MSLSKSKRINHFLWSQLSAAKTLNSISGNFETGPAVVNAFKKAKSTARSPEDRKTLGFLKEYRERLANDHRVIRSSLFNEDEKMKISEHAQKAASPEVYSDFYYFLTREADANDIVEIGTNFGVSGQSFVKGLSDNQKENSFFFFF